MLAPGDRIGDWIVVETIGEGGMGAVFRCHNVLSKNIQAAVKVLKQHGLGNARERFLREVELLASVQHPAVVRVLGGGEDADRKLMYMAMEYLEGEHLGDVLAKGPLPWERACQLFQQLGAGLLAAHEKGVVHRDIKPQNIVICTDGTAKLLDFGIAVQTGGAKLTSEGSIPGTLSYMPPEVFEGKKPDHRGDIYALGVVLWEALTGAEAFPHDPTTTEQQNMVRIMGSKLDAEPLDPGPKFQAAIRRLVREATEAEVNKRMKELGPFVRGLDEARSSTGAKAFEPAPAAGGGRGCAIFAFIALTVLTLGALAVTTVVVGGGALFLTSGSDSPQPSPEAPQPWASPTPSPTSAPIPGPAAQSVPDEFPFPVPPEARIYSASTNTMGSLVTYIVIYEIQGPDAAQLIATYKQEFVAKGLEVSQSESTDATGTTLTVMGWTPSGASALASFRPNTMGPGLLGTVTWTPKSQ